MTNDLHKFEPTGEVNVYGLICQGFGYASVCWTDIEGAGVFQSSAAVAAAKEVTAGVHRIMHTELVKLLDPTGAAGEWNDAIETAIKAVERA